MMTTSASATEPLISRLSATPPDWIPHRIVGLTKLMETTRHLAAQTELDPILNLVTEGACQALECERASLFLYDESRRELYTRVATELELCEIRMKIDEGINGWVGRHRCLLNVPDPRADPRWSPDIDRQTGFQTRGILVAPLISPRDERLLGTLQLLNKRDGTLFDRADENLLEAFAAHAAVSLERAELLEKLHKTRELQGSLDAARKVQMRFLPERLPVLPGYELAAWWQPTLAVGGDYYDAIPLPDGRLALVTADVSGHGLGPSLIMASIRAMLHVLSRTISDPARILTLLNETISPDLQSGRFITFLLGALDPVRHQFHFCNAGHSPAFHLRRRTGTVRQFEPTCCPIGVVTGDCHESAEPVILEPGDLMVFATDGATEIRDAEKQMFGRKRFEQLVLDHQHMPAPELLALLKQAITGYFPGAHPDDDITIFVVERKFE